MSNLDAAPVLVGPDPVGPDAVGASLTHPVASPGTGGVAARPVHQVFAGREVALGPSMTVRRLLPNLHRRLVGAWCFVDHYGPKDISDAAGMTVPPHPHIGLQTVSWLLD